MKSTLIIFGVALYIICLPIIIWSLHSARVDDYTQTFAQVSTNATEVTANITLSKALWGSDASNVTSISSNESADDPSASAYNSVSKILTIGGLVSSDNRTLSVEYEIASTTLAELTGGSTLVLVVFVFVIMAVLGLIAGAIYQLGQEVRLY